MVILNIDKQFYIWLEFIGGDRDKTFLYGRKQ